MMAGIGICPFSLCIIYNKVNSVKLEHDLLIFIVGEAVGECGWKILYH